MLLPLWILVKIKDVVDWLLASNLVEQAQSLRCKLVQLLVLLILLEFPDGGTSRDL